MFYGRRWWHNCVFCIKRGCADTVAYKYTVQPISYAMVQLRAPCNLFHTSFAVRPAQRSLPWLREQHSNKRGSSVNRPSYRLQSRTTPTLLVLWPSANGAAIPRVPGAIQVKPLGPHGVDQVLKFYYINSTENHRPPVATKGS